MRVESVVSEVLGECLVGLNARHARTLEAAVAASLRTESLSLTAIGRGLQSKTKPKHSIKRIDRFLGHESVHEAVEDMYGALAAKVAGKVPRLVVLLDWTDAESAGFVALCASVALEGGGRSVLIRNESYARKHLNSIKIAKKFLDRLQAQLPKDRQVVVVTDAGFGVPFFEHVQNLGWDFVGRLTRQMYVGEYESEWLYRIDQHVFPMARRTPKSLGQCLVTAKNQFKAHVVTVKQKKRGRHGSPHRTRKGAHPGTPAFKKHQRRNNEPWVLASSLKNTSAGNIVKLYSRRMQIEENFRDIKNPRFGLSLQHMRSRDAERINVLMLIASLASLVAMVVGIALELENAHRHFQANTVKRRVLSRIVLGLIVIQSSNYSVTRRQARAALKALLKEAALAASLAANSEGIR